jgi:hypothetical protein
VLETPLVGLLDSRNHYAASADGQRFLLRRPALDPAPVTLIANWAGELQK